MHDEAQTRLHEEIVGTRSTLILIRGRGTTNKKYGHIYSSLNALKRKRILSTNNTTN